ncbi:MAG: deoxyribose-phosphate aldolase [Candidatus Fournierella pullistercoris]|uniref:Deoxyribose-phosphate aldolase n=1 Tax=Candidatus Allofournierella pullistercoris TaxID=2838597 RepID=A0A948WQ89_9FIRM|nr:deoxyribose-phosphate aldolase [Candidatus Fournierella pullistercoris]
MDNQMILSHVDHTLLKAESTWQEIRALCDEAVECKTASICINPGFVKQAVEYLDGKIPVCTVVGFPLGATDTDTKVFEAAKAIENGAKEVDMVINIGKLKDGELDYVEQEIRAIKEAIGDHILKVIIETCLLTEQEKETMCEIVCRAGADYIKTSTGFSTGGATFEDIALFQRCCAGRCKIKAAGGISTKEDMERFLELGADRLGTSRAVKILKGEQATGY